MTLGQRIQALRRSMDPLSRWQGCGVTAYLTFSGGYPDGPITVELEDSRGRAYRVEI